MVEFGIEEEVLLELSSMNGVMKCGKKGFRAHVIWTFLIVEWNWEGCANWLCQWTKVRSTMVFMYSK